MKFPFHYPRKSSELEQSFVRKQWRRKRPGGKVSSTYTAPMCFPLPTELKGKHIVDIIRDHPCGKYMESWPKFPEHMWFLVGYFRSKRCESNISAFQINLINITCSSFLEFHTFFGRDTSSRYDYGYCSFGCWCMGVGGEDFQLQRWEAMYVLRDLRLGLTVTCWIVWVIIQGQVLLSTKGKQTRPGSLWENKGRAQNHLRHQY